MRKLFLLACLLAGALARPPQSHAPRHYGGDDEHDSDDHDHHYHHHDHYYHHEDDDGHHEDPHDSDDHEDAHFIKVHSGGSENGGQYGGHGYHESSTGHFIKVYHSNQQVDHHEHHEEEEQEEEEEEPQRHHGYYGGDCCDGDDFCEWEGWSTDPPDCDCTKDCDCGDCACHTDADQSSHLDQLTHQAGVISDLLDSYMSPEDIHEEFAGLADDLNELDGSACEHHKDFQCGGENPHCIGHTLVCDGHSDCDNDSDEDEYHCHVATEQGSHWVGSVVYDHCTRRKPDAMDLTIKSVTTLSWFTASPQVVAQVKVEKKTDESHSYSNFEIHGHWDAAERELFLSPPEEDGLALTCKFHGHDHDMCVGHVVRQISMEPCAEFIFRRT